MKIQLAATASLFLFLIMLITGCGSGGNSYTDGDIQGDGDDSPTDGDLSGDSDDSSTDGDLPGDGDAGDGDFTEFDADPSDGDFSDGDVDITDGESPEYTDCVELYGEGWAFNPSAASGDGCKDCSSKQCPEESSVGIFHITTEFGRCICETKDGYFFSDTTFLPAPCDKDNDGWTTVTAREFMEHEDAALCDNARCDVRAISEFVLVPEEEGYAPVAVPAGDLLLYEPNNRDDQDLLATDTTRAPAYGEEFLTANQLNSLTKACVEANADYNGNGASDIAEWEGNPGIDEDMVIYSPFSYFIETHHGWYDEPTSRYFIAENSRTDSTAGTAVPLDLGDEISEYWRECARHVDTYYDPEAPTIGMDFAAFEGMMHHSQFKCIQAVLNQELDAEQPQKMTVDQITSGFALDRCEVMSGEEPPDGDLEKVDADGRDQRADGDLDVETEAEEPWIEVPDPDPTIANPKYPELSCEVNDNVVVGDVGFAAVNYIHYEDAGDYQRGCVNECAEGWEGIVSCNGYPDSASCDTDAISYGMGTCGCIGNYLYPDCTSCINHYDASYDCEQCNPHWDLASLCTTCSEHFSLASGCTSCTGHWAGSECSFCQNNWTYESGCTLCAYHFNIATNCTACLNNSTDGHWAGTNCNECVSNWDINNNCKSCLDNDTSGHWNVTDSCNSCKSHYYSGSVTSSNLVSNPSGGSGSQYWTVEANSMVTASSDANGSFLWVRSAAFSSGYVYQFVDISDHMAKLSNASIYSGIKIAASAYAFKVDASSSAYMSIELLDKAQKSLASQTYTTAESTQHLLGPYNVTDATILSNTRYLKIRLGAIGGMNSSAGFRSVSVTVSHNPSTVQPCRFCEDGWSDSNTIDSVPDCLKCSGTSISTDTEHWNSSSTSVCRECWNDDTHGHWDYPDCSTCRLLWSFPNCTSCSSLFAKDSANECSKSVTLVQNGGAESTDMSMWNSNIPVSRHTEHSDIDSAKVGQYFFSFNQASGEKSPYAEQRITISDTYRSLISSGNIGWVYFSAYLAEHVDTDTAFVKIYQVTTPGTSGYQCGGTISSSSGSWVLKSSSCTVRSDVREIRVRLEVENDNGGAANGYFDEIEVHFSAKVGQ